MDQEELLAVVAREYGIEGPADPLAGYDDQNILLTRSGGEKCLVKLACLDTDPEFLEKQTAMLNNLPSPMDGVSYPKVYPNQKGAYITGVSQGTSTRYLRVLTYLEGTVMSECGRSPELYLDFGKQLAALDKRLSGCKPHGLYRGGYIWDLQNASKVEPLLDHVTNPARRTLAGYFISQYKNKVAPELLRLRKNVIHGDANENNVLVSDGRISGFFDFGDAAYTQLVNELAIALAYVCMGQERPLVQAVEVVRGYHATVPLQTQELDLLYYLTAARMCTTAAMAACSRAKEPGNAYISTHEEPAWNLLDTWIQINPLRARREFYGACKLSPGRPESAGACRERRNRHISSALSVSYDAPVKMEQGGLQYLYDSRGDTYLDCVNNVCHVGHCHPGVVQAAQKQMARLNTNTRYMYDSLNEYAEKLVATLPKTLDVVFFTNSGSEAADLAVRIARTVTGRQHTLVLSGAYHGNSTACVEMSPYKFEGRGGFPKPEHIHVVPVPDTYRGMYKTGEPETGKKYARQIIPIREALRKKDGGIAAFLCESIVSCGGQVVLPEGYLQEAYSLVREDGGLCIADEVQTGFGRVGSHFWAFELQDVVPDMVAMGKPMGNGHPLSGVVTTRAIAEAFDNGMEYFNTFGGNPVSCEVGKAVLRAIEDGDLQNHALETGGYFLKALKGLQREFPLIGDVRGRGLFLGIELVKDRRTLEPAAREASQLINRMRERHILLSTDGPLHNVIKIKPPLHFNKRNAGLVVQQLRACLQLVT